jgi:hypothetical protein
MRPLTTICICFLTLTVIPVCRAQENKPEYRGVAGAELQDGSGRIKSGDDGRIIEMGDRLIVEVSNLDGWLYDSLKTGVFPKQDWFDPAAVKLIVETDLKTLYAKTALGQNEPQHELLQDARDSVDRMLSDIKQRLYLKLGPAQLRHLAAEDAHVRQDTNGVLHFAFPIRDTPEDRPEWNKLRNTHGQLRPVSISLAFDLNGVTHILRTQLGSSLDSVPSNASEHQFKFRVYSWYWALAFFVIYGVFVVMFFWLAGIPNFLRDPDGPMRDGMHVFSLSRCQLAWWFFVILAAWALLLLTTSSLDTFSQTALILVGIGGGTALLGAAAGKMRAAIADENIVTANRPPFFQTPFGAWLYDILSDNDTIGFHRFQLVVWNVVLGIVFFQQAWSNFAMPEFSQTLLGLLGLSGATYVGMKLAR